MPSNTTWDAELYESRHAFVWQFGEALVELLNPQPGERVLDLGCGPGQLTAKIAERGASPLGLDSSPEMIGQARQNYPNLTFVLENAASMSFENEFDAVFSNAALHWMLDQSAVALRIARALRTHGRFVAELGGKGNLAAIYRAIEKVLSRTGPLPPARTFYPSLSEYATILEAHGLEVRRAQLFERPTPLEGDAGLSDWIRQFKWYFFEALDAPQRRAALRDVVEELRPVLFHDGRWYADYRRLRIIAVKV